MLRRLLHALRTRPEEERRSDGDVVRDRKIDARRDLVDGRAVTADGKLVDFESDLEPPRP